MSQLDCRDVRKLVQSFLDGELPRERAGLVADHLDQCEACGVEATVLERVRAEIHRLRTPAPDTSGLGSLFDDLPA